MDIWKGFPAYVVPLRELSHECETDLVLPAVLAALMVQHNTYFD